MIKNIVIIGSGNVASHLAPALFAAGIEIVQVYSRRITRARKLAKRVNAKPINQLSAITPTADIYLFIITDTAVAPVAKALTQQVQLPKTAVFAHTSGATPITVFKGIVKRYGIFYPLQTFTKGKPVNFSTIPFCIDGNQKTIRKNLTTLAQLLSPNVTHLSDTQRAHLHVAAVFANNFTNHLFTISEELLADQGLSFDLLRPLILETAMKVQDQSPADMQTGPARRGDEATIERHLGILEGQENGKGEISEVYRILSGLIGKNKRRE